MVRSTTPPSVDLDAVWPTGRAESAGACVVAVAYSGGRDSTALLHATARMARAHGGIEVLALHVHHGLSSHADAWLAHAQAQCQQWANEGLPITLHWRHLHLKSAAGQSIEALARSKRYDALAQMAQHVHCDLVLLAHHQQDQAETFLLQALRGAGVAGLSAMPRHTWRAGIHWVRPWLGWSAVSLATYIEHHGLSHIEDDSNADVRFARNRLRHQIWPNLVQAFAQAETSLAHAAAHQADVKACLDDWLSTKLPDITQAVEPPPGLALVVASWRLCADGPQRELIRAWFKQVTGHVLPASWVMRLHREVKGASAHWPMAWHNSERGMLNGQLVLYRGLLYWRSNATIDGAHGIAHPAVALSIALSFEQVGLFHVPQASGAVRLVNTQHKGVALQRLNACELRWRQGGEQFQMAPNRPARCLKKQFQAAHVPSWVRHQPLLWSGNQLIFVPGLGIDARAWAHEGEPQVDLAWLPDVDRLK